MVILVLLSGLSRLAFSAGDLRSDTWVATDALGRKLPGYAECGPPRAGRYVAILYEPWFDPERITSWKDRNWMLLFMDTDCNSSTGWQGYDVLVNSPAVSAGKTTVKRSLSGWNWKTVRSARFAVSGNKLELAIPRSMLGLKGKRVSFDFHWADNTQKKGNIIEFATSGDSAPNRRFNYRYRARE